MLYHIYIVQHLKFESRDKPKLDIDILNIKYGEKTIEMRKIELGLLNLCCFLIVEDEGFLDALQLLLM